MTKTTYTLEPIGKIVVEEEHGIYQLQIDPPYRPALQGLESCSHAQVLWWADKHDNQEDRQNSLVMDLPYAPGHTSGVFANRSQSRPNPICLTTAYILAVDQPAGTVSLAYLDAFDGTPLLDIKPYLPMADRVMSAGYPGWMEGFPESMEEAAEFFSDPENLEKFS